MSRVELYRAVSSSPARREKGLRDYFWRFVKNGNVMADGGGYSRRIDCLTGCAAVLGGRVGPIGIDRYDLGRDVWSTVPVVDLTRKASR